MSAGMRWDRAGGPGQARASEKILVLDRGNVELGFPRDWSVEPNPEGFIKLEDPTNSCMIEVSYLTLPQLPPGAPPLPPLPELLRHILMDAPGADAATPIVTSERGGLRLAWADYLYECDDTERGERRQAHGRWLLASNGLFQVLTTYYYWTDDTSWAVPAWDRMIETLRLGDGVPLESPKDHWALRDRYD